jgi:subtilisin family serine protease
MKQFVFKVLPAVATDAKMPGLADKIFLIAVFLLVSAMAQAQQFVPIEWQNAAAYDQNPWVRDGNKDRVDDLIDTKLGKEIDLVLDLNQSLPRSTLISNYKQYVADTTRDIYIDNFVSFVVLRDVPADCVKASIIKRPEVFLVEFAGAMRAASETTIRSMGIRSGFYSLQTLQDDPSFSSLSGLGTGLAILDCGVDDGGHQAFLPLPSQFLVGWDFSTSTAGSPINPAPFNQHATVMALIALGRGTGVPGVPRTFQGIAPKADLADVKAFSSVTPGSDGVSSTRFDYVVAALDKIITFPAFFARRFVVNLSFTQYDHLDPSGVPVPLRGDGRNEAFSQLVNYAAAQGLVCVASVGNNRSWGPGWITTPGAAFGAITVGASVTNQSATTNGQNRNNHLKANISSSGPLNSSSSYRWKPDLLAPGVHQVPPSISGLTLPEKMTGVTYQELATYGSSISTAHISGVAALMLEYSPNLTPPCPPSTPALKRMPGMIVLAPVL